MQQSHWTTKSYPLVYDQCYATGIMDSEATLKKWIGLTFLYALGVVLLLINVKTSLRKKRNGENDFLITVEISGEVRVLLDIVQIVEGTIKQLLQDSGNLAAKSSFTPYDPSLKLHMIPSLLLIMIHLLIDDS